MASTPTPETSPRFLTIADLSRGVVFLQRIVTQSIEVDGVKKEVWLKGPSDPSPRPYLKAVSGTGFLLVSGDKLFLVTAGHVAADMDMTATVTLAGPDDRPETLPLSELGGSQDIRWVVHAESDAAVLPLHPQPGLIRGSLQGRFLPAELLVSEESAPSRETAITVIGFPKGLGVKERFSPLTLQTFPASGLLSYRRADRPVDTAFFFLQNPSVGGYSGAPVFDISIHSLGAVTARGSGTRCYGLVHGTLSDDTGGKLTAIVPASRIAELLRR